MKKISTLLLCSTITASVYAQKVGIGTTDPAMALHVETADSTVLQVTNSTPLAENVSTGLYLKNGNYYTGALRTIGSSENVARLGLFTYAGIAPGQLQERLSITDGGFVGINTSSPQAQLHVLGTQKVENNGLLNTYALDVRSTGNIAASTPALYVQSTSTGSASGTTNAASTGLLAWNGQLAAIQPGTAITAHSVNGNGLYAMSIKSNGFSILGNSVLQNVTSARFQNSGGGKALVTSGGVQIEGQGAAAGRVLTSDASGNATWQESGSQVGFRGFLTDNFSLSPTSTFPVTGITTITNTGNTLNGPSGEFTAPSDGWYLFSINVEFTLPTSAMRMAVDFIQNGFINTGLTQPFLISTATGVQTDTRSVTQVLRLTAGDKISFQFRHIAGTGTINLLGQPSATTTMFHGVKL